jgi:hypothetical protein
LNGIAPNIFFPALAIFTKRDGEGGIRLFAAQLPMSVVKQLEKPYQSAAVHQDWRGDLEQSDARWGRDPKMVESFGGARDSVNGYISHFGAEYSIRLERWVWATRRSREWAQIWIGNLCLPHLPAQTNSAEANFNHRFNLLN